MSITVTVDASDTLLKLDEILKNADRIQDVIEFYAYTMINDIVLQARSDAPLKTGRLSESIHSEGSYPSYTIIADAKNEYGQFYAKYVEEGTSKMEAQPYLWPAIYEGIAEFKSKISQDLKKAIIGE